MEYQERVRVGTAQDLLCARDSLSLSLPLSLARAHTFLRHVFARLKSAMASRRAPIRHFSLAVAKSCGAVQLKSPPSLVPYGVTSPSW